jgi:hypothetical protein
VKSKGRATRPALGHNRLARVSAKPWRGEIEKGRELHLDGAGRDGVAEADVYLEADDGGGDARREAEADSAVSSPSRMGPTSSELGSRVTPSSGTVTWATWRQ